MPSPFGGDGTGDVPACGRGARGRSDGLLERLVSEDVYMHMIWNGYAMRTRQEKSSIQYAFPRERLLQ